MLGDCHIHMVLDGVDWKKSIARGVEDSFIHRALLSYQRLGYRYLRDGGDRWGVGLRARTLASQYGIVYKTPLSPLHKLGHYGGFIGTGFENLRQYADLVKTQGDKGADFIKIMVSGLMDFNCFGAVTQPPLDSRTITQMVHIAKDMGFSVMAHCNGGEAMLAAAAAGVDSIEHGAYAHPEALHAMAEMGVVWVPTLSTVGNLLGKGRFPDSQVARILEDTMEKLSIFVDLGGLAAAGSDAGAWSVPHGCHTESRWLEKAGVDCQRQQTALEKIIQKF